VQTGTVNTNLPLHGQGGSYIFDARSLITALFSIVSASNRLSFAFSLSRSFSRRASETFSPPYSAF
jgi:hypothetical protein